MVLSRMQLTLHATRRTLHGASRLVHATSAWSVKTRHAPSRHCRDGEVYSLDTTAMLEMSPPLPPRLPQGRKVPVLDAKEEISSLAIRSGTPPFCHKLGGGRVGGGIEWQVQQA